MELQDHGKAKASRSPRLTLNFAVFGAIVLCIAGLLMMVVDQRTADSDISKWAEANNASLTQAIANSVWPRFSDHLESARYRPVAELRQDPVTKRLFEEIRTLVANLGVLKVKLYETGGMTVFSTQSSQIGADYSKNVRFLKSLKGGFASKLEFREKFGDWPPREWQHTSPRAPDDATRSWVRSRMIAYAKAQRAA